MGWLADITGTLDALDARTNPGTQTDIEQLEKLSRKLEQLTAQIGNLSPADAAEAEAHLPTVMLRLQTVMDKLETNRASTADELRALRQRSAAARAYGK